MNKIVNLFTRETIEQTETGTALVVAPVEIDTQSLMLAQTIQAQIQAGTMAGLCIVAVNPISHQPIVAACDTLDSLAHEALRLYALKLVEEGLLDAMDERTNYVEADIPEPETPPEEPVTP